MDIEYLKGWIGSETLDTDMLAPRHARLMAATLGQEGQALAEGAELPPLWHWIYFLEGLPPAQLGRDGHPARGGFLPPVPLSNRMWAGGTVDFLAPLRLGALARKRSRIESVEHKRGRSGELVFVTVLHELEQGGQVAVRERHDIVYKDATPAGTPAPPAPAMPPVMQSREFRPDSTLLFRYSALTFNGHRIHYDQDYCRQVEGYENLVVHGPLNATLLAGWACQAAARPLRRFVYRGLRPALLGQTLTLNAGALQADGSVVAWLGLQDGAPSMQAQAYF